MKRLFKVANVYFQDKQAAKAYCDQYPGATVQRGPDHMGKHGHSSKMRANKER